MDNPLKKNKGKSKKNVNKNVLYERLSKSELKKVLKSGSEGPEYRG
jgi:hypothetical protein